MRLVLLRRPGSAGAASTLRAVRAAVVARHGGCGAISMVFTGVRSFVSGGA